MREAARDLKRPAPDAVPRRAAALLALCGVGLASAAPAAGADTNATPATLSIEFRRGRMHVPVRVNGSAPKSFLLDTGYSLTMVHPDLVEPLGLRRVGRVTIVGIAGEEEAGTYEGARFDFNGVSWAPRRVAALPSESGRRRRDGILGSGFFRRFVVELDPAAKTLRLREPPEFQYAGRGEILALTFRRDTPVVDAAIARTNAEPARGRFEVDLGCDSGVCLGSRFVAEHRLAGMAGATRDSTRNGVGGSVRSQAGRVPALWLGRLKVEQPSANFFEDGSPVDGDLAGHIGMDALRHFRLIFDYSRRRMILEPLEPTAQEKKR
jgi:hypothetical protein